MHQAKAFRNQVNDSDDVHIDIYLMFRADTYQTSNEFTAESRLRGTLHKFVK